MRTPQIKVGAAVHSRTVSMNPNWYQQTTAEVAQALGSDISAGLSAQEAQARLAQFGPNELVEKAGRSRREIIIEQLSGVLTILLLIAVLVSAFLGDWIEAVVILIIIVLNAFLGYTQEYRAEQSMAALKRMSVPHVRVRRDGAVQEVLATELTPGDLVILETGNIVPADGRVLSSINMRVEEAALTGESEPVDKDADLVFETERALGDRRNMVYSGTIVNYGRGEFMVTETGMATELGHIATLSCHHLAEFLESRTVVANGRYHFLRPVQTIRLTRQQQHVARYLQAMCPKVSRTAAL